MHASTSRDGRQATPNPDTLGGNSFRAPARRVTDVTFDGRMYLKRITYMRWGDRVHAQNRD
jgi:hypothetical protein